MKRERGQFFTIANPFKVNPFYNWYESIPLDISKEVLLEPFAGSNNIIELLESLNLPKPAGWKSYDISPPEINKVEEYPVELRDTIKDFPKGHNVIITNPPYLAKNSATRRGLPFPNTKYDDLYKECLSLMLENADYVAAIIPESFLTSGLFLDRLDVVVSLNMRMFDDTECPVCLALFSPKADRTLIYRMDEPLGVLSDLREQLDIIAPKQSDLSDIWKFNDPSGSIGACLVDNQKEASIFFCEGEKIPEVKSTSRANTRISGVVFKDEAERQAFIKHANAVLSEYREKTHDVFMTSFKGLRQDGKYRRRLDFKAARAILTKAYLEICPLRLTGSKNI